MVCHIIEIRLYNEIFQLKHSTEIVNDMSWLPKGGLFFDEKKNESEISKV